MAMVCKKVLIKGDVQDAAYRIFVKKVAMALGVKGLVKNLPDGTVEVHCEADRKVFKRFKKILESSSFDGIRSDARVRGLEVQDLEQKAGSFEGFEIDYGQKVSGMKKEEMHRQELMVFHGSQLRGEIREGFDNLGRDVKEVGKDVKEVGRKVDGVGKDVKEVGRKVDGVGKDVKEVGRKVDGVGKDVKEVGQKIDSMHDDVNDRFDSLDEKYHVVSEALLAHTKAIEALVEDYIAEKRRRMERDGERS